MCAKKLRQAVEIIHGGGGSGSGGHRNMAVVALAALAVAGRGGGWLDGDVSIYYYVTK